MIQVKQTTTVNIRHYLIPI